MSDDHSARAGSLNTSLQSVSMEIDDDDEDIIMVVIELTNESAIPVGGLSAALVSDKGQRFEPIDGISSIGPGLTRQFKFEASIDAGEWTFEFNGGGHAISLGPYAADFEFQANKGRKMGNAIGSTLFSGAFDNHLDDFGTTEERGIIDAETITMTSYFGENSEGGSTKVILGESGSADEEDGPRTPPWQSEKPAAVEPTPAAAASRPDPLLAPLKPLTPLTPPTPPAAEPEPEPEPVPELEPQPLSVPEPVEKAKPAPATASTPPPLPS
ncbi:hypothetical protein N9M68_07230, partial [Candidatus Poseidonia alphae]|nr:hypothetical protein [Candidatus Poseidonia alphae]MDB2568899.1 hypothetical protein [Candidatus Poseidonia alphae]